MTFSIYDQKTFLKSLLPKYRKNKTHKYIKPGDIYIGQYNVINGDTTKTLVSSTIEFLAPQDSLIKEIINVNLSLPSSGESLALTNNSETPLKFLNLTASNIMNAFGQNGIMMAILTTDNAYKPIVTQKTLTQPIHINQNFPSREMTDAEWQTINHDQANVYTTSDVYQITYQPVTAKFLLLTTNLGVSNYASFHTGIAVPLGQNEAFQIDSNQNITWSDSAKVSSYINYSNPQMLSTSSIDKGRKLLLINLSNGSSRNPNAVFNIPQKYCDGTSLIPPGASYEDYILDYKNSEALWNSLTIETNPNDKFKIDVFPIKSKQNLTPYHKSN